MRFAASVAPIPSEAISARACCVLLSGAMSVLSMFRTIIAKTAIDILG